MAFAEDAARRVRVQGEWTVGQPGWVCEVAGNGATWRQAAVVTVADGREVQAQTLRAPHRYQSFDLRGESRVIERSHLPDRWLEKTHRVADG